MAKKSEASAMKCKNDLATITNNLLSDAKGIIDSTRSRAYVAVNVAMLERNWYLGKRIAVEEIKGENRAEYGAKIIDELSKQLTKIYGKGFTKTNLYSFLQFFKTFPKIFHSVSGKSMSPLLTWTHYRCLLRVFDDKAREWYLNEALLENWSVRTLERNISTQYYSRLLASQKKEPVKREMQKKTAAFQQDKLEFIKNPVVAEFLNLSPNMDFTESKLESTIISHLQKFVLELGKGFAFVARQQHIHTDLQDYFIDLVFYNYILKCFVLIDLKAGAVVHQDIGQMDMYVRMYDELKRGKDDNPTIGIVLGSDTSKDIARYSILNGNKCLFQAKYMAYMPSPRELELEIERQKEIFKLQNESDNSAQVNAKSRKGKNVGKNKIETHVKAMR